MPAGLLTGITNNPLLMSHGSVFPPCGRERQNPKKTLIFTTKPYISPQIKQQPNQNKREQHHPQPCLLIRVRVIDRDTTRGTQPYPRPGSFFPTIPSFPGALCRPLRLGTPEGWRSQGTALSPPFPRSGRSGQRQRDQGDSSSRRIRCRHRSTTRQAAPAKGSSITQGQPRLSEEEEEDWGPGTATRPGTVRG